MPFPSTLQAKLRTISGLPTHRHLVNSLNVTWILNGLKTFWEKVNVFELAARACCKQYCLSE
jgi:hypothetical protein